MNIYIDLETIPTQRDDVRQRFVEEAERAAMEREPPANYKKEEAIAKWRAEQMAGAMEEANKRYRATSLNGGYGEILVIGWAADEEPVNTLTTAYESPEADVLSLFWRDIERAVMGRQPKWIGHNVGFDLRFLYQRSVICNTTPSVYLPYNDAPWRGSYVDLMYEWCGARDRVKLTVLCDMLGIDISADDIDGSQVYDAWLQGEITKIVEHCERDVERVRQIYWRLRYWV